MPKSYGTPDSQKKASDNPDQTQMPEDDTDADTMTYTAAEKAAAETV